MIPPDIEDDSVDALYELNDLREADTKYLQMSDGTVRALTYGSVIHRTNAEGDWQDIDNSLTVKENLICSERVSFARVLDEDSALFTLTDGEKSLSVSLIDAASGVPADIVNDGYGDGKPETKFEELSQVLQRRAATLIAIYAYIT